MFAAVFVTLASVARRTTIIFSDLERLLDEPQAFYLHSCKAAVVAGLLKRLPSSGTATVLSGASRNPDLESTRQPTRIP